MSSFVVRPASCADLAQLPALYLHLNPYDRSASIDVAVQRLEALGKLEGSAVVLGTLDGAIVASCTLMVIPNLTRGGQPYGLIENVGGRLRAEQDWLSSASNARPP